MNNKFIYLVLSFVSNLTLCSAVTRAYDTSNWPTIKIQLTQKNTLKDIFDSGLRPFRHPSLEKSLLEAKHVNVVVVQPSGQKLPVYNAEIIDIYSYRNDLLGSIEFQNHGRNIEDCKIEMMRWIKFGKMPPRTEQQIDEFLSEVRKNPETYNDISKIGFDDFNIHWQDEFKNDYNIWFLKNGGNLEKPLKVCMKIGFPLSLKDYDSYDVPIPPPLGYENVDMTAPDDFGPDSEPMSPEQERLTRESKMPDYSDTKLFPRERLNTKREPVPPLGSLTPQTPSVPNGPSSTEEKLWISFGVGAVLISALIYLTRRNSRRK